MQQKKKLKGEVATVVDSISGSKGLLSLCTSKQNEAASLCPQSVPDDFEGSVKELRAALKDVNKKVADLDTVRGVDLDRYEQELRALLDTLEAQVTVATDNVAGLDYVIGEAKKAAKRSRMAGRYQREKVVNALVRGGGPQPFCKKLVAALVAGESSWSERAKVYDEPEVLDWEKICYWNKSPGPR
jgi:hypothetical protein